MLYHTDMNIGRDTLGGDILQHQWWLKTIIDKVVLRRHQNDKKQSQSLISLGIYWHTTQLKIGLCLSLKRQMISTLSHL